MERQRLIHPGREVYYLSIQGHGCNGAGREWVWYYGRVVWIPMGMFEEAYYSGNWW